MTPAEAQAIARRLWYEHVGEWHARPSSRGAYRFEMLGPTETADLIARVQAGASTAADLLGSRRNEWEARHKWKRR